MAKNKRYPEPAEQQKLDVMDLAEQHQGKLIAAYVIAGFLTFGSIYDGAGDAFEKGPGALLGGVLWPAYWAGSVSIGIAHGMRRSDDRVTMPITNGSGSCTLVNNAYWTCH